MLCSCRAGFVGDSISVYQVAWGQPAKGSQEPRWGWVHWPLDGSSSPPWDPNRPLLRRSAAAAAWQAKALLLVGTQELFAQKRVHALAVQQRRKSCTCIDCYYTMYNSSTRHNVVGVEFTPDSSSCIHGFKVTAATWKKVTFRTFISSPIKLQFRKWQPYIIDNLTSGISGCLNFSKW